MAVTDLAGPVAMNHSPKNHKDFLFGANTFLFFIHLLQQADWPILLVRYKTHTLFTPTEHRSLSMAISRISPHVSRIQA